ncbi:MAG: PAS domain S-box protein [Alphaproteobacteria bacterium]|nr:PAS domain S-box protein [Alphaproteobacteria bacterium]
MRNTDAVSTLLLAANLVRMMPSTAEVSRLVEAMLVDLPGVTRAALRIEPGATPIGVCDGNRLCFTLQSRGRALGLLEVEMQNSGLAAALRYALQNFSNLIGLELGFRELHAELERTNGALKANAERFADFARIASDWLWETDRDGIYTFVTDAVQVVGVAPSEIVGRHYAAMNELLSIAPLEDAAGLREIFAARRPYRDRSFRIRGRDGRVRTLEVSGAPIFDAAGAFAGYRGAARDVTALRQTRDDLERALVAEREMSAQQRRFVAITSHEFRTPLAIIDGATQRLLAGDRPARDDGTIGRLERIRAAVRRMTQLIDRTLTSARLEDGRIELQPRRCDLLALLRAAIDQQHSISPEFTFGLAAGPGSATVVGDPRLIEQIFTNLLSNAVKFSRGERRIDVGVADVDGGYAVTVRDYGVGIAEDEIPKLFQRFFRASSALGIAGTGLGLHLVRELVAMHGGSIAVESRPGEGTTFRVTLPISFAVPIAAA